MFSVIIYHMASGEVSDRLQRFQTNLQQQPDLEMMPGRFNFAALRLSELNQASTNMVSDLVYINLFVFAVGGFASYILARRNLLPIERAHEAQSRFTSDASHELRTPLAVMKTELEVALMDKNASADSLRQVIVSNLEEVDKLSKLSQMLLNLSQFDHAKLEIEPVNLGKVVRGVIADFDLPTSRLLLNSKKHPVVRGNETAIAELVKILIDNALQYSPNDSLVVINIQKQDGFGAFEITNTGAGIPADKLPHIFDRFYRADSSRTNGDHKGYGLGLALAKTIVQLHHGELSVSSTPGHQTIFNFTLPLNTVFQAKTKS